jgi:hypothetical protein
MTAGTPSHRIGNDSKPKIALGGLNARKGVSAITPAVAINKYRPGLLLVSDLRLPTTSTTSAARVTKDSSPIMVHHLNFFVHFFGGLPIDSTILHFSL